MSRRGRQTPTFWEWLLGIEPPVEQIEVGLFESMPDGYEEAPPSSQSDQEGSGFSFNPFNPPDTSDEPWFDLRLW